LSIETPNHDEGYNAALLKKTVHFVSLEHVASAECPGFWESNFSTASPHRNYQVSLEINVQEKEDGRSEE
jgi:hypothetical protein